MLYSFLIFLKYLIRWIARNAGLPKVCHSDEALWEHPFRRSFVGTPVPTKLRGNTYSDEAFWEQLFIHSDAGQWEHTFLRRFMGRPFATKILENVCAYFLQQHKMAPTFVGMLVFSCLILHSNLTLNNGLFRLTKKRLSLYSFQLKIFGNIVLYKITLQCLIMP